MRTGIRLIFGILAFLLGFSSLQAAAASAPSTAQQDAVKQKLSGMQIPFIENKGQMDKSVAFYAPTFAGTVFVTKKGELVYSLPANNTDEDGKSSSVQVLTERLVAGKPVPAPLTAATTQVSYFLGNDKTKWQSGVSTQSAISLGEVWEGIDVELHAHGKNVEKFFTVNPGASVDMIQVQLDGAKSLKISQDGALDVATESGTVRFTPPVAWQERDGKKLPVQVAYLVKEDVYGFKLGQHDASLPVIIDPLLQSTYLGGVGYDTAKTIAIDPVSGDVYVAGFTAVTTFPGTNGGAQAVNGGGNYDIFIARLNSDLTMLIQSTYLGGSNTEGSPSLAIHPITGDIYVAGATYSSNFPGVNGGAQSAFGGTQDSFIARLNSSLTTLIQSTFLGGSSDENSPVIAIHPVTGEVYIAATTSSSDFPGATGGAMATYAGAIDVSIARLSGDLSTLVQSTYLGGRGVDYAPSISVHPMSGEVYVAAASTSTKIPRTAGGALAANRGLSDNFITRMDSSLTTFHQSTYLGGSNDEFLPFIAIHPVSGDVYVAASTHSSDFPRIMGGAQAKFGGGTEDAYIAHLDSALTTLIQATYLGENHDWRGENSFETVQHLAIHPITGDIYIGGTTNSDAFPGTAGGADSYTDAFSYGFASRLSDTLTTLHQSTYLGGGYVDDYQGIKAIAFHPVSGEVYLAGNTSSVVFPGTSGGAQAAASSGDQLAGDSEAFISRLTPSLALDDTPPFTLTVSLTGAGTGAVTSGDSLINCGTDCSEDYAMNNTLVTLTATADAGSKFSSWLGACAGNIAPTCTVTMSTHKSVLAKFNRSVPAVGK